MTSSKIRVDLVSRSRTRNRNPPARSPRSINTLRACWATHVPSGLAVTPRTWTNRVPTSTTKKTYKRRSSTVSTEKKSHASVPAAWARMKSRHRSSARRGAGPRPARFRIRRIVAPLIAYPRFFSSPRIRSYPPRGVLSRASLSTRATIAGSIGGLRPSNDILQPAQDGVRADDQMQSPQLGAGKPVEESGEDGAVCPSEARFAGLSLQDGELVAQGKDLDVLVGVAHR